MGTTWHHFAERHMVNCGDLVSRKEELRIREFGDFLTSVQIACVQRFSAMSEVNINNYR